MGHKEELLQGAKQCLAEKGYARTTARDIVAASGTNLASIGYHFGSKENLLAAAMIDALGEFGDEVERALSAAADSDPMKRLEMTWTGLIESYQANRGVWLASLEVYRLVTIPGLQGQFAEAYQLARRGLASLFLGVPEDQVSDEVAATTGSLLLAIIPGLVGQWIIDPDRAPSGKDIATGLRHIMDVVNARP
ncbi:TetR/AcrR family transcriptional regulator [Allorhizocola rhizosphaerae]|uniref:TetR/AcrR family transcriptional regulator n=1 Tax=Allorhizocola rhizosphaerae TaxID=1872709 RepID=UPI000E3C5CCA|nr:TetR/AcrR family transcriptional regulator [Allorhizocola rhizosphaerae]